VEVIAQFILEGLAELGTGSAAGVASAQKTNTTNAFHPSERRRRRPTGRPSVLPLSPDRERVTSRASDTGMDDKP
jgi:hypothetical protein